MSQTPAQYFETFFAEKDLSTTTWEIEDARDVHILSSEFVIELLTSLPDDQGSRQIAATLRTLDFRNAPILPYLRYLANAYVQTTSAHPLPAPANA